MSITENKKVILRFNEEFLQNGNKEVLKDLIADNFTNHTAAPGVSKDVVGLIQFVGAMHKGLHNIRVEILDMIGEGDLVSTRKIIHAVHGGEMMGKPATGKTVAINVLDMVRVVNGKYVDHWGRNDMMQVVQGL